MMGAIFMKFGRAPATSIIFIVYSVIALMRLSVKGPLGQWRQESPEYITFLNSFTFLGKLGK